jgi:hypothetical protein
MHDIEMNKGRGDSVELHITTGPLPRGARLTLSTEGGESLGAVTPYPPGRRSNTATVPVPRSAIVDGRLRPPAGIGAGRASARLGPARFNVSSLSWRRAANDFPYRGECSASVLEVPDASDGKVLGGSPVRLDHADQTDCV